MKVAAIQHDIAWEDPAATTANLRPRIADAVGQGAGLVCLSEMYSTGFSMATDTIAELPDGPSTTFLFDQASEHGVWVGGTVPTRMSHGAKPINRFVLAGPSGEVHAYAKIHPFTYADEHEHYAAGTDHAVVDIDGLRVAMFVCYDLRFADEFWALAERTDCYIIPANWPAKRSAHWRALLVARAIENQAYVIGINRVGVGGKLEYSGDSRIIDPLGEVLAGASSGEAVLVADIDPAVVATTRSRFPFLQDRR